MSRKSKPNVNLAAQLPLNECESFAKKTVPLYMPETALLRNDIVLSNDIVLRNDIEMVRNDTIIRNDIVLRNDTVLRNDIVLRKM